ncbi:type I restriction-modification system subunit M [candidate division WOR-1 bacterium RIFOXYB2_FULL_42_35]|uniref:site-specific DNA-methyltransferase (adenine-specific) n=1 Tax=candidate division WOR-1 bacterium RIFOXYC2_FULL_41_25 TaxID=1802586 RepID=A0A1F4TK76_UNCSA|nr:MAG: type I restriction-modification system subunit M [candidate division WOR-1 bacterium RIFOXYA2_FULL_41_14]OGC22301.1 MAG: type I restriction-modification system subunit M [candidate division WOR-1 bacterium RIFOXYB2_FULL_42_35]OGC32920.1 MAG: type I restriction-modification system subunit M [candidate division WOR-1 bacterium RIFOXYC2_FULL_41_25]
MANGKTNQDEINAVAWKACDTFRGVVDPSEYKNYILVFLFLKYLSDLWKDKKEQYKKEHGTDSVRIKRKMERERFVLPENCDFDTIYSKRDVSNIGEVINLALEGIEEANKAKLEGVFRNIDFNSESSLGQTKDRNKRLKHLIEDFADERLDLRPSRIGTLDVIGNTYEYLISHFASDAGKKGGEFYTPAEVAILLAKLLQPKSGERVCDPTCGSGSLLIRVAKEIKDHNFSLYGQESNGSTWALCKINMFLHGIDNARIEWGDTLNNPKLIENDTLMKFDIVTANPPFSLKKWGAENAGADKFRRFYRGVPPKSKGDYAFITHMVETINETGRVAVIVPHGVLFRGGSEGVIRKKFIEENIIDAVIGLPSNLFYGVGIPVTVLIFRKSRKNKDVLFIDASRDFDKDKTQNKLRTDHIEKIATTYKEYQAKDRYSYCATLKEIKENDFNLNIPRYVDVFENEEAVDIMKTQKEIQSLENEQAVVRKEMAGLLKEMGL